MRAFDSRRGRFALYTACGAGAVATSEPTSPDWYHNLAANPTVTVELPDERFDAQATVAEGDERDRLFAAQASVMPAFADYHHKTARRLPVVILDRV